MTDWEKRAYGIVQDAKLVTPGCEIRASAQQCVKLMLQLAREMADARAEEIAKAIEDKDASYGPGALLYSASWAAAIARSTIKKTAPVLPVTNADGVPLEQLIRGRTTKPEAALWATPSDVVQAEAAIRADEREKVAEAIAARIDKINQASTVGRTTEELCASIARAFKPSSNPPSRERVLEEALRVIRAGIGIDGFPVDSETIAKAALDWKP